MVIEWEEIHEGREGTFADSGLRTRTRHFRARTNDPNDDAAVIGDYVGATQSCPQLYDFFVTPTTVDLGLRVVEIKPTQDQNDPLTWKVDVKYSNRWNTRALERDPTDRAVVISFRTERQVEAIQKDINDNVIANTLGDPFDPPLSRLKPILKISIKKNFSSWDPLEMQYYIDKINLWPFLGFPSQSVLCWDLSADIQYEDQYTYWAGSFEFHVDVKDFWRVKKHNTGPRFKSALTDEIRPAETNDGRPTNFCYLDADGYKLDPLDPAFEPVELTFDVHEQTDFDRLGLV